MILPLEDSFLCGEIIGNANLKVETGSNLILCNEDVEQILDLWGKLTGKDRVASDAELH